jgi:hypothetical protein
MRFSSFAGVAMIVVALFLAFNRVALAGRTISEGDVSITERDERKEGRLLTIGVVIGILGVAVVVAGAGGPKNRDAQ